MTVITLELLVKIKSCFRLNWHGTHGVYHWCRVYENGKILARQDGVNERVVQLFSVFHDSQRKNEHWDKKHGKRGAEFAATLRSYCSLDDREFAQLTTACTLHTLAQDHSDITVQACFDSDRLDLGRVGTTPKSQYLCTPVGKMQETIRAGIERSVNQEIPENPFGLPYEETKFLL